MANELLIEKQTGGYFKFTLNGDTSNAITSIQNDLLAVGNQLHFKTGNGANIIKEQFIYPEDVTIIAGGTFTFTTVAQVWNKLIDIDYFAWLGGGGDGVDRFDDLLDTFQYTGNAGKVAVVDNSEVRLVPITLYNKRLFTELEDTPNSLVPDKMVVVNPTGTALILQDQPEPPEQFLNSVGYFDYEDLITQTVPLTAVANVAKKLTNDTEGLNTNTDQNPYGVSFVWDFINNQFNFSELTIGDTIDIRIHIKVTTTTSNQKVDISGKFGIGSASEFTNVIYSGQFKTSGQHEISFVAPFYLGSLDIINNPAELYLTTDANATIRIHGWYVRILRKNINIITVDYEVPDATTLTKGIVRLAGDLAGNANNPTVPALATKVPNSRLVNTTSPLLGGGNLGSDLTLSIQQANSVNSGFLSFGDWINFNNAHNDKIVSAAVTGTTTKTLSLNQHDGGTITATWDDNDTAITIGTPANGLSLSGQELSLGLSSASTIGALSSTDWNTFNSKQPALNGTGFVKIIGTTISYDDSIYALDSVVVKLTGDQTITGTKTFNNSTSANGIIINNLSTGNGIVSNNSSLGSAIFSQNNGTGTAITVYNNSSGRGIYFLNNSTGNNLVLDNSSSATGLPFSILKNGTDRFTINDSGEATGVKFIVTGGTSSQFLKANGSLDSTAYVPTSRTLTINGTTFDLSANRSWTINTGITGSGTTNYIPKFTGSTSIGNSNIIDNGSFIDILTGAFIAGNLNVNGVVSSGTPSNTLSILSNSGAIFVKNSLNETAYAFQLNTSSGLDLWSTNSGGTSTRRITLDSSGNLGIGTTSPTNFVPFGYGVNIEASGGRGGGFVSSNSDSTVKMVMHVDGSANLGQLKTLTNHALMFATNDTERMRITSGGNVGIGTTFFPGPNYKFVVSQGTDRVFAISQQDTEMSLEAYNSAGTASVPLRFYASKYSFNTGNVGIGTTSPFTVTNQTSLTLDGVNASRLDMFSGGVRRAGFYADSGISNLGSVTAIPLTFSTSDTERMRITSSGNVGIGTTSPVSALTVGGSSGGVTTPTAITMDGTYRTGALSFDSLKFYLYKSSTESYGLGLGNLGEVTYWAGTSSSGIHAFYTSQTERMRITSGGNVGIGTTSPSAKLDVVGSVRSLGSDAGYFFNNRGTSTIYGLYGNSGTIFIFNGDLGNIASINSSSGAYTALSDRNKKKDFEESTIGLDAVLKLKPTLYRLKSDDDNAEKKLGFIAQEVKEFIPQAYTETKGENEDFIGLDYNSIIPVLVKAIQELKAEIEILKNK